MTWSNGCKTLEVLGGRCTNWILDGVKFLGVHDVLSRNNDFDSILFGLYRYQIFFAFFLFDSPFTASTNTVTDNEGFDLLHLEVIKDKVFFFQRTDIMWGARTPLLVKL